MMIISRKWLLVGLLLGTWPLTTWLQETRSDPAVFEGPESYIRHHLVEPIKPKYPDSAREAAIKGEVLVFVCFDEEGNFIAAKPLRSAHELLLEAVIEALKDSRIKPPAPLYRGANYISELRFIFSLKDGKGDVVEAPESEQQRVSREFTKASKTFMQEFGRREKKDSP